MLLEYGANLDYKIKIKNGTTTSRQLLMSKREKQSFCNALNDNSKGGVDRLGYKAYSIGIYNTVKAAQLPLCVGLIAEWGHGNIPFPL